MIKRNLHTTLFGFFIMVMLVSTWGLCAQKENTREKYIWFDNLVGQINSGIFKGELYVNDYRVVNDKHQFFSKIDFSLGSVGYKNQIYFDVPLNYDVYLGILLVENRELSYRPIMIFDEVDITDFTLNGRSFIRIADSTAINISGGFFEVLLKGDDFALYKKHIKKIFERTDEKTLYYEFKNDHFYLIHLGGTYYKFKKVKELNRIFPESRKDLKVISKKHEAMRNLDTDTYLKAILKDLSTAAPIEKANAQ